jgi:hypothetical protein
MTVKELILELQYQPQDLEVSIVDDGKKRFKEHRDIAVNMQAPELADPYVMIRFNLQPEE